jgi:hypothetical protein
MRGSSKMATATLIMEAKFTMFSKFSRFTNLSQLPQGCDAVNDDGVCIKKQTPWVNPLSLRNCACTLKLTLFF